MEWKRRNSKGQFRKSSEAVADITFDPGSIESDINIENMLAGGTMTVVFNERGTYEYYGVTYATYLQFKDSPSWGEYFNDYIRPVYLDYQRVA